ncbi:NADPH:quinone reductase [Nocardioides sp.]|uniref:NADPH:quinone reductase n=1 Tax=Nocardioides sp. TaxID=35761 RepID=UPI002719D155|nr:NADPH:quinone reductase [Nocardioides sp.]MDO9456394.1 NADPH:quinone reductase [Nocardioides sp.]
MRAAVYTDNGPSSVLHVVDLPDPSPGPGEVVVRLVRAGVNPTDWKFRAGMMPKAHEQVSPGQDGAGTVEAVGDDVTGFAVGDRVWLRPAQHGRPIGTAAELTVQPVDNVSPLPDAASYDVGASLGVPALTAHRALSFTSDEGRVAPGALAGRTVLVAGGAGAVGNAAIQLAVWAGATVVTTVSSDDKAALARAAGAQHVVDYTTEDVVARVREIAPDGVALVVEVAPAQNFDLDLDVVANHGVIAFYANNGGDEVTMPLRPSFSKNVRLQGILLYTVGADALREGAEDVTAAVAAGALRVGDEAGVPLHHFPLEETAAAHDAVENGAVGKVLIDIG